MWDFSKRNMVCIWRTRPRTNSPSNHTDRKVLIAKAKVSLKPSVVPARLLYTCPLMAKETCVKVNVTQFQDETFTKLQFTKCSLHFTKPISFRVSYSIQWENELLRCKVISTWPRCASACPVDYRILRGSCVFGWEAVGCHILLQLWMMLFNSTYAKTPACSSAGVCLACGETWRVSGVFQLSSHW